MLAIEDGVLAEADAIYMLHCDPSVDIGTIGLREGPITGAADAIDVQLRGTGGHTSRPHLTQDLTFALGKLVTELPAALSRRLDPRAGASVVWGVVQAGKAKNVIPATGHAGGTVRSELLEGSAHGPCIDAADRWLAVLLGFLDDVRAGS